MAQADTTTTTTDTAAPLIDLTGFERDCLTAVAILGSPHGLAVKSELEKHYEKNVNHGRLYPALDSLADKGLIEKGEEDRRTNWYAITARGERELEADVDFRLQGIDA